MTASEARRNPRLRRRVAQSAETSDRAVADLLDGYHGRESLVERIRAALAAEGVDLETLPKRTPAEVAAWKRRRQPRLDNAMPDGYALEQCDCGREYPRMQSEAEGRCPRCWRKLVERMKRERDDALAELGAR